MQKKFNDVLYSKNTLFSGLASGSLQSPGIFQRGLCGFVQMCIGMPDAWVNVGGQRGWLWVESQDLFFCMIPDSTSFSGFKQHSFFNQIGQVFFQCVAGVFF